MVWIKKSKKTSFISSSEQIALKQIKKVGMKMKKLLTVFLVVLALFSFVGCDDSTPSPEDQLPSIPDKIEIPEASETMPEELRTLYDEFNASAVSYTSMSGAGYDKNGNLIYSYTETESGAIYKLGSKIKVDGLKILKANSTIKFTGSEENANVEVDGKKVNLEEFMVEFETVQRINTLFKSSDRTTYNTKIKETTYSVVEEYVYVGEDSKETITITPAYNGITSYSVYNYDVIEITGGEYNGKVYNLY